MRPDSIRCAVKDAACGTRHASGAMRAASLAQGMSQEKMMLQGTLTNCTPVDFPPAPKVSNEAKVALPTGSLGTTDRHRVLWVL